MRKIYIFAVLLCALMLLLDTDSYGQSGRGPRRDSDSNPPGVTGGPGTNWENPPGPAGGPGASPNARQARPRPPIAAVGAQQAQVSPVVTSVTSGTLVTESWEKTADTNKDGIVDIIEMEQWHKTQH